MKTRQAKMKEYNFDSDNIIDPWEQEQIDEAEKIKNLQEKYLVREEQREKKTEKLKELTEKKTTEKEKKELRKKAESIKKLYALDYWMRCFNNTSFYNDAMGQGFFHVCLGQALNHSKIYNSDGSYIDYRLHMLIIQDSGSGKGKAINLITRVFRHPKFKKVEKVEKSSLSKRSYKIHKLGRMNAASLINTFEVNKKGIVKTDKNGLETLNIGILEGYDFIFSEEARVLLSGYAENLELQEILMTSMEPMGSINNIYTKQLTNYKSECNTRCTASFIYTTRPFGKVKKILAESGLIQRMMFLPRELDYDDRKKMNRLSAFSFETSGSITSFEEDFDMLIDELNKVVSFAYNNKIDFRKDKVEELQAFLYEQIMYFTDDIENKIPNDSNRKILQSIVSRYRVNMSIMAFHSAVMRHSKWVEKQDLQYAFDYFKKLFEAQKLWVGVVVEEDKDVKYEDRDIIKELKRIIRQDINDALVMSDVIKEMGKIFGKSYEAMRYHIIKFTKGDNPRIKLEGKGHSKKVRLL